jgi:hypothetical protein
VDRIDFYRRGNVEAGLFETQTQSARSREQIDGNRTHRFPTNFVHDIFQTACAFNHASILFPDKPEKLRP